MLIEEIDRVLIVSIKYLGSHPCPLCKIHISDIDQLGSAEDDLRRQDIRMDSLARQKKVVTARRGILQKGWAVTSENVKDRVGEYSGIAVQVRSTKSNNTGNLILHRRPRTPFLPSFCLLLSISFVSSCLIFCTRSNKVHGGLWRYILCG